MKNLYDKFDEETGLSYWEYIHSCKVNGNNSSLKETLKELSPEALVSAYAVAIDAWGASEYRTHYIKEHIIEMLNLTVEQGEEQ